MTPLSALSALCLFLLVAAQTPEFVPNSEGFDTADDRVSSYALGANCDCTGTGAAVVPEVKKMLADGVVYINSIESERSLGTSYEVLNNCTNKYGLDTCMNAEASLRVTPTTTTLCIYDKTTGANLAEDDTGLLRPVVKCKPAKVSSTTTTTTPTPSPNTSTNPPPKSKPSPSKSVLVSPTPTSKSQNTAPAPKDATKKPVTEPAKSPAPAPSKAPTKPSTPATPPSPPPAQKVDPTKTPTPGSTDPSSGSTSTDAASTIPAAASPTPESGGGGNSPIFGGSEASNVVESSTPAPTPVVNEGCIAVEHLHGVKLQHRTHLWREVLCARGVCATRNHALVVDGVYTCMGEVCKRERCVRTMKFVNNLNVWKNRRVAIADGIIATPYDVRFPKWGVWLVQTAEFALEAVRDAGALVSVGVVTAVIVLARARKSRGGAV